MVVKIYFRYQIGLSFYNCENYETYLHSVISFGFHQLETFTESIHLFHLFTVWFGERWFRRSRSILKLIKLVFVLFDFLNKWWNKIYTKGHVNWQFLEWRHLIGFIMFEINIHQAARDGSKDCAYEYFTLLYFGTLVLGPKICINSSQISLDSRNDEGVSQNLDKTLIKFSSYLLLNWRVKFIVKVI